MKRIITPATDYTPAIDLNPANLTMQFTGVSRPENVGLFFQQIIEWVDDLSKEINAHVPGTLRLIFKLGYCNSASQKYILILLEKIAELRSKQLNVIVDWYYDEGDDKMLEDGEDISDAIGIKFNLLAN
jgi:hypothetical protein